MEEYLCAVSRGLIQSICIQINKQSYKSLTADRIFIHPSSVMFKMNPRIIVAGEIVRTTKMYARSVSPLQHHWLKRISPELFLRLVEGKGNRGKIKKERDFTNRIKIGKEAFPVQIVKGKKVVILRWEKIHPIIERINPNLLPNYKGLKGKIVYKESEILSGVKLNKILSLVNHINFKDGILHNWPKKNIFVFKEHVHRLLDQIENVLKPCLGNKNSKKLGFLTLQTDGSGRFWFKCLNNFDSALMNNLTSLEALADEPNSLLNKNEIDKINHLYRKFSRLIID